MAENLLRVRETIVRAAERAGRAPSTVELVAITKTWPPEVIREAAAAGHRVFGENRVQEAAQKIPELPGNLIWHLVGHLQVNKARKALSLFRVIHSVDSLALATQMQRIATEEGLFPEVYLQVNLAGESSKSGFAPGDLRNDLDALLALDRLSILGLMTVPPFVPDPESTRPHFRALRQLGEELAIRGGISLPGLSMGMSHDYAVAIEEGATVVRVGSAIFGDRPRPQGNP